LSTRYEIGYAFAKLMFLLLGALQVFLVEVIVAGELLQMPFFENLAASSRVKRLEVSAMQAIACLT